MMDMHCRECGEELWGCEERFGVCLRCRREEDREDDEPDEPLHFRDVIGEGE